MSLFGKKLTAKEQMRQQDRALKKTERELDRDKRKLELEEKKLEAEIRRNAKAGNKETCAVLAKQLVQLRKQKARSCAASSRVHAVSAQQKTMGANVKLAGAMANTAKTMGQMNRAVNPQQLARTMHQFEQENAKMGMSEEMMNDTLDDLLTESGDEEEGDAVVNQVLDEIGIEISNKVRDAPAAERGAVGSRSALPTDSELADQLTKLRAN